MTEPNRDPWTHLAIGRSCFGWGMTVEEAERNARRHAPSPRTAFEVWEIPAECDLRISGLDGSISWTGPDPKRVRP